MIASLYQSGSSSAAAGAGETATDGSASLVGSLAMGEGEDMSLMDAGIEPHVIPLAAPAVAGIGEQIGDIVRGRGVGRPQVGRYLHVAVLHVERIEVDDDEDRVETIG